MSVLLLALTIGGLGLAILLMIIAGVTRTVWLAKFIFGAVGVWLAVYAVLLVSVSIMSEEKTLSLNEPKEFCGFYLDCHLHAAVTNLRKTKTIGNKTATGEFYVVRVKIFSDARRATLPVKSAKLYVADGDGKLYGRFEAAENPEPPFEQTIPAGGAFEKQVVFDLPENVKNPRLDVSVNSDFIELFLIGDEDSLWHKRQLFKLELSI